MPSQPSPITGRSECLPGGPLPGDTKCNACGSSDVDDLAPLDWIVIGGGSGTDARPFDLAWARATIAQCRAAGVAAFMKQAGSQPYLG